MSPYWTTQEQKKGKDKETWRGEGSRGIKRLQICWAEWKTPWHIPYSELGPDQNGCVIKWTVMLVPDTMQPSLELVMVLFSSKVPLRGQCLLASITVYSEYPLPTSNLQNNTCVFGEGVLSNSLHSKEEYTSGTKEACFVMFREFGITMCFSWGRRGREGQGEGEK